MVRNKNGVLGIHSRSRRGNSIIENTLEKVINKRRVQGVQGARGQVIFDCGMQNARCGIKDPKSLPAGRLALPQGEVKLLLRCPTSQGLR